MKIDDLIGHECAISFSPSEPTEIRGGYSYYVVHAIDRGAGMICVTEVVRGGGALWVPLAGVLWIEVPHAAAPAPAPPRERRPTEEEVEAAVLEAIRAEPGMCARALRDAVPHRAIDTDKAVATLIDRGVVKDTGMANWRSYHAAIARRPSPPDPS